MYQSPIGGQCRDAAVWAAVASRIRTATRSQPSDWRTVTDDARPLLVFFSSARSGPSRRMESLLAHIARKERSRLRVAQVDVDDRPRARRAASASRRRRRSCSCRDKRAVARLEGRASAPQIEAMLEEHLEPEAVAAA